MTEDPGVQTESVAETQSEAVEQQTNSQEANWEEARRTMAEQKQKMDMLEQQNRLLQQQQELYRNNMNQQQNSQAQEKMPWETVDDDDVLTGADYKKAMQQGWQLIQGNLSKQQEEMRKLALKSQYPDYEKVVGYALKEAEQNPALAQAIQTSGDPYTLAYEIGKRSDQYQSAEKAKTVSEEAKRIVENSQKPGSVNAASTGSGALSKASHFLQMSDRDFEAHVAKLKRGVL